MRRASIDKRDIQITARAQSRIDKVRRLVEVARQVECDGIVRRNAEELHADVLVISLQETSKSNKVTLLLAERKRTNTSVVRTKPPTVPQSCHLEFIFPA